MQTKCCFYARTMPRLFTPSQPEAFPDLQFIGAIQPDIPEGETPELLAAGFNSSAWRVGSQVIKATKQAKDISGAKQLLDTMQGEHEILAASLADYMPETQYTLALREDTNEAHVVTLQPFVEATSLPDFLLRIRCGSSWLNQGRFLKPEGGCPTSHVSKTSSTY